MNKHFLRAIALCCLGCAHVLSPAYSYEVNTHDDLSRHTATASNLNSYLSEIGLNSLNDPLTDISTTRTIIDWIRSDAVDEDDYVSASFFRFRNHFFNPLPGAPNGGGYTFGPFTGVPSPNWGLEDTQNLITQAYSLKEARQYFYDGLTLSTEDNRKQFLARTFSSLGHVIHLIQDAAQPQHTRNDSHGGFFLGARSL